MDVELLQLEVIIQTVLDIVYFAISQGVLVVPLQTQLALAVFIRGLAKRDFARNALLVVDFVCIDVEVMGEAIHALRARIEPSSVNLAIADGDTGSLEEWKTLMTDIDKSRLASRTIESQLGIVLSIVSSCISIGIRQVDDSQSTVIGHLEKSIVRIIITEALGKWREAIYVKELIVLGLGPVHITKLVR